MTAQRMLTRHLARSYARLHTATAKSIGKARYEFLLAYIDQLSDELGFLADRQPEPSVTQSRP